MPNIYRSRLIYYVFRPLLTALPTCFWNLVVYTIHEIEKYARNAILVFFGFLHKQKTNRAYQEAWHCTLHSLDGNVLYYNMHHIIWQLLKYWQKNLSATKIYQYLDNQPHWQILPPFKEIETYVRGFGIVLKTPTSKWKMFEGCFLLWVGGHYNTLAGRKYKAIHGGVQGAVGHSLMTDHIW